MTHQNEKFILLRRLCRAGDFLLEEVAHIATTRIIPMHINKGKTIAQCLTDRTDYAKNPDKTNDGELISAYACDLRTADAEFLLSKRQYRTITGKEEVNNVIAYQVRQSFKPGEVTPEDANRIGYEFALRFTKGQHAFIVCTHIDKAHIHNHIIWNSTTLDCTRKFRDFLGSGRAVARLSDLICTEHQLSVIDHPQRSNTGYGTWLGKRARPSHREQLRGAIDGALAKHPHDFDAFLALLSAEGYQVKQDKQLVFGHKDFRQNIRMDTLGDGYTEAEIRAVIRGQAAHAPKRRRGIVAEDRPQSIMDIQAKLSAGMGEGYRRWATVENLKRMAKTKLYMDEHGLSYEEMSRRKDELTQRSHELSEKMNQAQTRLAEINVLKTHIVNYSKTRDVYVAYRNSGYSKKFLDEHEADIIIHKAAKKAFDEMGVKKLPTVKSLQAEFAQRLSEKKDTYAELKQVRDELRELAVHQRNYEELRDLEKQAAHKEKAHDRE
jgi:hypothetical protein